MEQKKYTSGVLLRRFVPYFKKYRKTLAMDLFCAALTTLCELVLPLIMRYITNEGLRDLASLSMKTIGGLGFLYLVLRIVDCIAGYYMADMGHVMGASIETDIRDYELSRSDSCEPNEWKYSPQENIAICSQCGYEHYLGTYHQYATNFCPNCGTKMKAIN